MGIGKNDPVALLVQKDGSLVVRTIESVENEKIREKEIEATPESSPAFILRQLIGAYLMGAGIIRLRCRKGFTPELTECAHEFAQRTLGPEILEETSTLITIKDLMNADQLSLDQAIRRIFTLVKKMHQDVIISVRSNDRDLAREVIQRDVEVDRLHWFVEHQYNAFSQNLFVIEKKGLSRATPGYYYVSSRLMERIADHASRIAQYSLELMDLPPDPNLLDKISAASSRAMKVFGDTMDSWLKKDIALANSSIEESQALAGECDTITQNLEHGAGATVAAYIIESIRRSAELAARISELVINHLSM